ncbi:leucine-rich repeat-containing protein 28-like [Parasteatoda tepidariorum]|uniref:leucine-rich repeat-containing protein 28-like n=1 Tax=Parasteatoda tepidariorum TaxID=114398 RepID=UPI0039BC7A59
MPNICQAPGIFDNAFSYLRKISEINMRCPLHSIEDNAFGHTRSLTKLLLSKTKFHGIPSAISRIKNLKTLEIVDGKLTVITTELQYMPELVNLTLTENRISSLLGSAFLGDQKLQSIILTSNRLSSLDNEIFDPCLSLRLVKLDKNALVTVDGLFQNPSLMPLRLRGSIERYA